MHSARLNAFLGYFGVLLFLILVTPVWSQDAPAKSQVPADNTKVNQQDRQQSEPTADQQKNNTSDVELTRQIRRSLTGDKSLSTYAHNVKVVAQNGRVTLKGPVRSDAEKSAILAKAAEIAGQTNINDEITVAPEQK
jgi:osmotically-inducible protein OsmY